MQKSFISLILIGNFIFYFIERIENYKGFLHYNSVPGFILILWYYIQIYRNNILNMDKVLICDKFRPSDPICKPQITMITKPAFLIKVLHTINHKTYKRIWKNYTRNTLIRTGIYNVCTFLIAIFDFQFLINMLEQK